MREIKFRAWEKVGEEMWEVRKIDFFNKQGRKIEPLLTMKSKIKGVEFGCEGLIRHFELMQFTGLKDKNGKEIYMGDVVEYISRVRHKATELIDTGLKDKRGKKLMQQYYALHDMAIEKGLIIWKNFSFKIDMFDYSYNERFFSIKQKDIKVIGNIYENPELLEEIEE